MLEMLLRAIPKFPSSKELEIIKFVNLFGSVERSSLHKAFFSNNEKSTAYRYLKKMVQKEYLATSKEKNKRFPFYYNGKSGKAALGFVGIKENNRPKIGSEELIGSLISSVLISECNIKTSAISFRSVDVAKKINRKQPPTLSITLQDQRHITFDICDELSMTNINCVIESTKNLSVAHSFLIVLHGNDLINSEILKKLPERSSCYPIWSENLERALVMKVGFLQEASTLIRRNGYV